RDDVHVIKGTAELGGIVVGDIEHPLTPFTFTVIVDNIEIAQFRLVIKDSSNNEWTEYIEVPIRTDAPEWTDFTIADGLNFTVATAGTTKTSMRLGKGNGDGIANPGESIVVLVADKEEKGLYRRNYLYTQDENVNPGGIHPRMSDNWGRYDHVGGSQKVSEPVIASNCPKGHVIEFFTEHWVPDYPNHIIKRGKVNVTVSGEDTTPPIILWAMIPGDNILQVKVVDGGKIDQVSATMHYTRIVNAGDHHEDFKVTLKDDGMNGDRIKGDNVFSRKIREQAFGLYTAEIKAVDRYGNSSVKALPEILTVY
ncbi:choice-of-anchor X domain-containing protein, partial [Candidatus Latescibacterota bacterium]